jgi:hypothetical protein
MLCTSRLVYSPSDLPVSSVLVYTRADLYYLLPTNYSPIIWNISYLFIICLFVRKLCSWFISGAQACVRTIRSSFVKITFLVSTGAVLSCFYCVRIYYSWYNIWSLCSIDNSRLSVVQYNEV